jgi:flagellar M-ring protein FliF
MEHLSSIRATLARLEPAKLAALGAVALGILILIGWVSFRSAEPMGLLYSGLDPAEAGRIGQRLDEMKVPFEARGDGTTIMVPVSQVARARMELAAAGMPHQEGAGYELLDSQSPMNMTSFMQRVQRLRALEGELSRTIVALDGVRVARVHIVLPERESFARDTLKPTASIGVVMNGAMRLSKRQALAIRLLVSGAVPGLKQEDVSVLDPSGAVLAADGSDGMASSRLDEMKTSREQALQHSVDDLLEPLVGRGHVRTAVSVAINGSREITREEKFDPQSQVERSKQTQIDSDTTEEVKPQEAVTVTQNIPTQPQQGGGSGNKNATSNTRNGQTVNYEISSTHSERVREPGEVQRLTVAVAVDGVTDDKGAFHPRSQAELDRIAALVKSAVGFDAKRGDQITVDTMRFVPADQIIGDGVEMTPPATSWSWLTIGGPVVLVLGAAAVMLLRRRRSIALVGGPGIAMAALEGPMDPAALALAGTPERLMLGTDVTIEPGPIAALHALVEQHPDEAVALIKAWIAEGSAA